MNKKMLVMSVWMLTIFCVAPDVTAEELGQEALRRQRELIGVGNAAYARGELQLALQSYVSAYAQNPSSELGYRIGQTHEQLGNYKAARESFARYLEQEPQTRYADRISAHIEKLRELELKAQPMLTIKTEPSMARVWINGQRQPELTPYSFALGSGVYRIKLELAAHSSVEDEVTLEAGAQIEREYRLEPLAKPEVEPTPEPEPAPEPEPEPEPEPRPESRPEPERPLTTVNIAPNMAVSVLSWNMMAVGTGLLALGALVWSLDGVGELSTGMVTSGASLVGVSGYLLFVKDWGADYEGRGRAFGEMDASRRARVVGPGLRLDF